MPQDKGARGVIAAIAIDRGDHRLHRVTQKRGFAPPAGKLFRPAQFQRRANIEVLGNLGAGFLAHQRVEPRCKLAFGRVWVGLQKRLGYCKAQHPVAQEFKALVVFAPGLGDGPVGQGLAQDGGIGKPVAQPVLQVLKGPCLCHSTRAKKRSDRQVQKNSIDRPADENMTRSARPIRFS